VRDTYPELDRKYVQTGQVLFSFRHFPVAATHSMALPLATAAACANGFGRFWSFHDALFVRQKEMKVDDISAIATQVGIENIEAFTTCLEQDSADVNGDVKSGRRLSIRGTPTFFLGTVEGGGVRVRHVLRGAASFTEFARVLDGLLKL